MRQDGGAAPEARADLLEREARLEREALAVGARLGLRRRLERIGEPRLVGAAALRVLHRRDIDVTTSCARLDPDTVGRIARLGARLAEHEDVREVTIRDDTGPWNCDPRYPDGFYLGLDCRSPLGNRWTVDLWFVDRPDRQPDLAHVRRFGPSMTDEVRAAVLALKAATREADGGEGPVPGHLVYQAVAEAGVRTAGQLRAWLDAAGGRSAPPA
ncbi:hypothetical protein ACFPZ0_20875 [Streptomonospora nanhaiensis]|uniref:Uncharacterized protein n=1 Tax=Streptomonospora nanhaiensis TaxID=1323731 RepID=A0A853BTK9_9ACTN|nr:hypothetical protein [Streptomonospora nanhaiensis]MBX9391786.1 hypothetical protein [Streptomonospora nanhaiensis]NYI98330.1 hypothetical protein [Streptomonospora nanhaiensis]